MADSSDKSDHDLPEFITARDLIPFIRERTGLPLTKGKLKNEVARGTGPPVVGKWGNCRLFDPSQALEWARSKVKPSAKQGSGHVEQSLGMALPGQSERSVNRVRGKRRP